MFEQVSLDTQGALRSPWVFTFSVLGQTGAIGSVFLFSLIHTEALPRSRFFATIAAPTGRAEPARQNRPTAVKLTSRAAGRPFTEPAAIPTSVATEAHGAELSLPDIAPGSDLPINGGIPSETGWTGDFWGKLPHPVAAPARSEPARKPATPAPSKPVPVSTGVQAAKLIAQVKPTYPPLAVGARISGTVRLAAVIGREGGIQNLQVLSGHPLLTQAALDAVRQWRYQPTLLNGEPVEVVTQIEVNFTLAR